MQKIILKQSHFFKQTIKPNYADYYVENICIGIYATSTNVFQHYNNKPPKKKNEMLYEIEELRCVART